MSQTTIPLDETLRRINAKATDLSRSFPAAGDEISKVASGETPGFAAQHPMARAYSAELALQGIQPTRNRPLVEPDPEALERANAELTAAVQRRKDRTAFQSIETAAKYDQGLARQYAKLQGDFNAVESDETLNDAEREIARGIVRERLNRLSQHPSVGVERKPPTPQEIGAIQVEGGGWILPSGYSYAPPAKTDGQSKPWQPLPPGSWENPESASRDFGTAPSDALNIRRAQAGLPPIEAAAEHRDDVREELRQRELARAEARRNGGRAPEQMPTGLSPADVTVKHAEEMRLERARLTAEEQARDNARADASLGLSADRFDYQQKRDAQEDQNRLQRDAVTAKAKADEDKAKADAEKLEREARAKNSGAVIDAYVAAAGQESPFDDGPWRSMAESGEIEPEKLATMIDRMRYNRAKKPKDPTYNEIAKQLPRSKRPKDAAGDPIADADLTPEQKAEGEKYGWDSEPQTDAQFKAYVRDGLKRVKEFKAEIEQTETRARAEALILEHPDWTDEQIADALRKEKSST